MRYNINELEMKNNLNESDDKLALNKTEPDTWHSKAKLDPVLDKLSRLISSKEELKYAIGYLNDIVSRW